MDDVRLAELGLRRRKHEHAPRIGACASRLGDVVRSLRHVPVAERPFRGDCLVEMVRVPEFRRVSRHAGDQRRSSICGTFHVPAGIVEEVALGHAHHRAVIVLHDKRQIHRLSLGRHVSGRSGGVDRLPAALQRITTLVVAVCRIHCGGGFGKRHSRRLVLHLHIAVERRLEPVCHAVVTRRQHDLPSALECHGRRIRAFVNRRFLVYRRGDRPHAPLLIYRKDLNAFAAEPPPPHDLQRERRLRNALHTVATNGIRKRRLRRQPDFVSAIGADGPNGLPRQIQKRKRPQHRKSDSLHHAFPLHFTTGSASPVTPNALAGRTRNATSPSVGSSNCPNTHRTGSMSLSSVQ